MRAGDREEGGSQVPVGSTWNNQLPVAAALLSHFYPSSWCSQCRQPFLGFPAAGLTVALMWHTGYSSLQVLPGSSLQSSERDATDCLFVNDFQRNEPFLSIRKSLGICWKRQAHSVHEPACVLKYEIPRKCIDRRVTCPHHGLPLAICPFLSRGDRLVFTSQCGSNGQAQQPFQRLDFSCFKVTTIEDPSGWCRPSSHLERPVESEVRYTGSTPTDRFACGESGLHCT